MVFRNCLRFWKILSGFLFWHERYLAFCRKQLCSVQLVTVFVNVQIVSRCEGFLTNVATPDGNFVVHFDRRGLWFLFWFIHFHADEMKLWLRVVGGQQRR